MKVQFTTRDGIEMNGVMMRQYPAFEGGMRYIIVADNREYRCIQVDGKYVEYVV